MNKIFSENNKINPLLSYRYITTKFFPVNYIFQKI